MPDAVMSCEMNARSSKEDWKWPRGLGSCPNCGEHWAGSEPRKQKWILVTSRLWDRKVEGFRVP